MCEYDGKASEANTRTETSEGLPFGTVLLTYSRNRFTVNLLPLLQRATSLRRVVTAGAAGKEGPISVNDFQGRKVSALSARGHATSLVTLSLEALAKKTPDVTFIHNFPGPVKTNFLRGGQGAAVFVMNGVFKLISPMMSFYSIQECGERHLFLATSARYVHLGVSLIDPGNWFAHVSRGKKRCFTSHECPVSQASHSRQSTLTRNSAQVPSRFEWECSIWSPSKWRNGSCKRH